MSKRQRGAERYAAKAKNEAVNEAVRADEWTVFGLPTGVPWWMVCRVGLVLLPLAMLFAPTVGFRNGAMTITGIVLASNSFGKKPPPA